MKKFNDYRKKTDAKEIKDVGYQFVDILANYLDYVQNTDSKVVNYMSPEDAFKIYDEPVPMEGMDLKKLLKEVVDPLLSHAQNLASPSYMGHQVCHPLVLSSFAKGLSSAINQGLAIQEMSPLGTMIEKRVIRWICNAVGYTDQGDGTIVSGGTEANLTGIMVARSVKAGHDIWKEGNRQPLVGFCSARSHYSIERAFGILGLGTQNLIKIRETSDFKMDVTDLKRAIADAIEQNKKPFVVIATAGCTPVGSFDDIETIALICKKHNLWLHVDGAHGGSFVFSDKLKHLLKGIQQADSIALDPHKMMFMPLNLGTILLKNQKHFDDTFKVNAPYIFHKTAANLGCLNIGERTIQCSRGFEAFKLWICLKHYGIQYFADMMNHCVDMTRYLYDQLDDSPDFETLNVPESNILCFRLIPESMRLSLPEVVDEFNFDLRNTFNRTGKAWITTTLLGGRRMLRTTIINPRTTKKHVDQMIIDLRETGGQIVN
ncbi:aminotransferase class I/II-fold pyridoxal phosphate-dependent enzyme [bacterium]|nr:aminotransferase class I/II-fold pyridoxal phosphate-dependent enzyme [bacterium]